MKKMLIILLTILAFSACIMDTSPTYAPPPSYLSTSSSSQGQGHLVVVNGMVHKDISLAKIWVEGEKVGWIEGNGFKYYPLPLRSCEVKVTGVVFINQILSLKIFM